MKKNLMISMVIVICGLILVACGSEEELEEERETLELSFYSFNYDEKTLELKVGFSTNLTEGVVADTIQLINPENEIVSEVKDRVIWERHHVRFTVPDDKKADVIAGNYHLELVFSVDSSEEVNKDFLNDRKVGGYLSDIESSDHVQVLDGYFNNFSLRLKSKEVLPLPEGVTFETYIEEEMEEEVADQHDLESDYIEEMKEHGALMAEQFHTFNNLFGSPQWDDLDWMIDLSVAITEIARLSELPANFVVPDKFSEVHQEYLNAMGLYSVTMEMLPPALDNRDASEIEEVAYGLELALGIVEKVHAKLN